MAKNKIFSSSSNQDTLDFFAFSHSPYNYSFEKVPQGLHFVFPEMHDSMQFYFGGPLYHLYSGINISNTISDSLFFFNKGVFRSKNIVYALELEKKLDLLKYDINKYKDGMFKFFEGVEKFLGDYHSYVEKNRPILMEKLVAGDNFQEFKDNCPYNGEYYYDLRSILRSDDLMSVLYRNVASPDDMKNFFEGSWNIYKSVLSFLPKRDCFDFVDAMVKFRKHVKDKQPKDLSKNEFGFYVNYLNVEKIDVKSLDEGLTSFKEMHHDVLSKSCIEKYFS